MATTKDIERFARLIAPGPMGLIHHRPEPDARPTLCFANVARKVARDGGRMVVGWMFQVRLVEAWAAEYLLAINHSIWNAPDGSTADVTPFHDEVRHHPVTLDGSVLFLLDAAAQPRIIRGAAASLPMRFHALGDDTRLVAHVRRLEAEEAETCSQIYAAAQAAPAGATIDASGTIIK